MEKNNVITKMVLVQMDVKMDIKGANAKLVKKKVIQPCLCKKKDRHDGCRYNSNRYQ